MSVSLAYKPAMTPQEFLAWEEKQEGRYEYLHGAIRAMSEGARNPDNIRAMSGGSWNHNSIIQNISRHLGNQLNDKPCAVFSQGLQVQAAQGDAYFYPDVGVICGEPTLIHNECTLLNPVLIMEVLSPSTEKRDRVRKLQAYQAIESLQEYVLVSQEVPVVECFRRKGEAWEHHLIVGLEAVLRLESVGCEIPLAEIYERVQFPEEDEE